MGRPAFYKTEEERINALRASWRAYGARHRVQSMIYSKKPEVIQRRKERYRAKHHPVEPGEPILAFARPRVQRVEPANANLGAEGLALT